MSFKIVDVKANSVGEAFEQAGLNWSVEQAEMINSANGKMIQDKKVLYRSDSGNQLGVVGSNYGVVQNSDCFAFFDAICQEHNANICKVTEYRGGSLVHLEAEVRDKKVEIRKGDEVGFRFNLWNSFDGLHKASVNYGVLRLVCTNGLVAMDREHSNVVSIRHSKNAVQRLEEAIRIWSGAEKWFEYFKTTASALAQKIVDRNMIDNFLNEVFSESESSVTLRKKEIVENLFDVGKGNGGGTAWDLYNGVTEYVDHFSKKENETLIEFANVGQGYDLKAKAFQVALTI